MKYWRVVLFFAVSLPLIKRLSRSGRRGRTSMIRLNLAAKLAKDSDASGALALYDKVRREERRRLRRGTGEGAGAPAIEIAETKMLDLSLRIDGLGARFVRELLASRPNGSAKWRELVGLATARLGDAAGDAAASAAGAAAAVAACAERPGCWAARLAGALRPGARRRERPRSCGRRFGWLCRFGFARPSRADAAAAAAAAAAARAAARGDGGWRAYEGWDLCEIDRRYDLSARAFRREYADGGRPVVFPIDARGDWSKAAFLDAHGATEIPVERDAAAAVRRRQGAPGVGAPETATLAELATNLGAADYVFAPDPLGGVDLAKATASRFFDDGKRFSRDAETRKRTALFFLGGRGSSTTYHEHSHAYNALFYGAKLWALLPPLAGDFRGGGAEGAAAAIARARPDAVSRLLPEWGAPPKSATPLGPLAVPRLCVQRAGEALFVPTGWAHAAINLADVIGAAVEVGDRPELRSFGGPA